MRTRTLLLSAICATLTLAPGAFAQKGADKGGRGGGGGSTIPLSTYSISPTKQKEKRPLTGTIVGGNPFATPPTGAVIDAVLIPVIVNIGSTTFDPTAPDACDGGVSAVNRFNSSPLVQPVADLTFNGVDVGTAQYGDGFMRAQFWNATGGSPAYTNSLNWATGAAIIVDAGANGITTPSPCGTLGVVYEGSLNTQLQTALQTLTTSGAVSTTKFVFFLMDNVVQSTVNPPVLPGNKGCCVGGYHTRTGTAPQFWAVAEYDTTGNHPGAGDIAIPSHEVGEFMNDPMGGNQTPAWGGIGQVAAGTCQGNFEVGDPLTRTTVALTLNGYTYHPQELAFFSWFFNANGTASLGAGGLFSSNGTFKGPSMACPPGGTY